MRQEKKSSRWNLFFSEIKGNKSQNFGSSFRILLLFFSCGNEISNTIACFLVASPLVPRSPKGRHHSNLSLDTLDGILPQKLLPGHTAIQRGRSGLHTDRNQANHQTWSREKEREKNKKVPQKERKLERTAARKCKKERKKITTNRKRHKGDPNGGCPLDRIKGSRLEDHTTKLGDDDLNDYGNEENDQKKSMPQNSAEDVQTCRN